jgi:flavodoxin
MTNPRWSAEENDQREDSKQEKKVEIKTWMHTFNHPDEQKEYIEKIKLGSQFDMRFRALFEFYGDELIAYKRKYNTSERVNEFLRILSKYFTEHLENKIPTSWKECYPPFWEELINAIFPHYMRFPIKQNQSKIFLTQLKKFVRWLDKRTGYKAYKTVEMLADESIHELVCCEQLLNELHLYFFPKANNNNWDPFEDLSIIEGRLKECCSTVDAIFQVKSIINGDVILCDIQTQQLYHLKTFPVQNLFSGILLHGIIGKRIEDTHWTWHFTEGVYPNRAKKYMHFEK